MGGKDAYLRAPNVAWEKCCTPKEEGGLGILNAKLWNKALLGKYTSWLATKQDHLWVKWVNHVYIKGCAWSDYTAPLDCSWSWKKIVQIKDLFKSGYCHNVWQHRPSSYSIASGYQWLQGSNPKVPWRFMCWNSLNVPRTSFICWASLHKRLLTRDRLVQMGICQDVLCCLCAKEPETHDHLFSGCDFTKRCVDLLKLKIRINFPEHDMVRWFSARTRFSVLQKLIAGACYVGLIYAVWSARNKARLLHHVIHPTVLVKRIWQEVMDRWKARNKRLLKPYDQQWISSML
ncbi:uncharacterized protein LOC141590350 [Silene latifolia]|uniref:uncharacterized protein LOC141590350 n=1 Tax=Silene latifolia TaxID=37657 RepID=UPI003D778B70